MAQTNAARSNLALSRPPDAAPITVAEGATTKKNLELFDKLDYEAWNGRDWELFSKLHGHHVHVSGAGATTDGIDAHVGWAKAVIAQVPNAKVTGHPLRLAVGDWTVVVGVLADGSKMATIARWENGSIAEEYLFSLMDGTAPAGAQKP